MRPVDLRPWVMARNCSAMRSSWVERAVIVRATCRKAVVSANALNSTSEGTTSGSRIYPNFLSGARLRARPAACTMSTTLCFGSANSTQSMAGMSTPSVKQRALVIKARPRCAKPRNRFARSPADFLLEM